MDEKLGKVLITGGAGFIGSHVARTLHENGVFVRIADIVARPEAIVACAAGEYLTCNLCDPASCVRAVRGIDTVIHLAANMGGMGMIHGANDFQIFRENQAMTLNMVEAALTAGVRTFLFASSACVYPDHRQTAAVENISLAEGDVWDGARPVCQGLYGLEKLVGELVLQHAAASTMQLRMARFHNVYGLGGTWHGGREKAPAAFARKALAAAMLNQTAPVVEMWGSGEQRRSFLYIDDCVDAVRRLLVSDYTAPLNIGSEEAVSMVDLARLAARAAGFDADDVTFDMIPGAPTGVAARCSDNALAREVLRWEPRVSLADGMQRTVDWLHGRMEVAASGNAAVIKSWLCSETVVLKDHVVTYALLVPVTSRGSARPDDCLDNLAVFATSLQRTTWRDLRALGEQGFAVRVYLLIDHDDTFLHDGRAGDVFRTAGISDVRTLICDQPRGHICALWRRGAQTAWEEGCEYFVLFGDDVQLLDEGWMREIHEEFSAQVAPGFGCIAFTDISFPGMPTFPVVSRVHMEIFQGQVVPDVFVNQDGDPFLFQLYRRFGTSRMLRLRLTNGVGGSNSPRYERQHAADWTLVPLDNATQTVEAWVAARGLTSSIPRLLTLDLVIPSFRVPLAVLGKIVTLKSSDTCSVMFVIIIDDPTAVAATEALEARHGHRSDVRIRAHTHNLGASATRNRGLQESAAEWVHFLDDDVDPAPDILFEIERAIRAHPSAAGFVGTVLFPPADTVFTSAVHLSGVTYFWDIAQKMPHHADLPWGVTASLTARRTVCPEVNFDMRYPKTGGGEDIHYCVTKRDLFVERGLDGFHAAPNVVATHPYWGGGRRSYTRFHLWSVGDGALCAAFPQHTFRCLYPTSAELLSATLVLLFAGLSIGSLALTALAARFTLSALIANIFADLLRHLVLERTIDARITLSPPLYALAVVESTFVRIWSEAGRLRGQLARGELTLRTYGCRFDWFVGRAGAGPRDHERRMSAQRFWMWVLVSAVSVICV